MVLEKSTPVSDELFSSKSRLVSFLEQEIKTLQNSIKDHMKL